MGRARRGARVSVRRREKKNPKRRKLFRRAIDDRKEKRKPTCRPRELCPHACLVATARLSGFRDRRGSDDGAGRGFRSGQAGAGVNAPDVASVAEDHGVFVRGAAAVLAPEGLQLLRHLLEALRGGDAKAGREKEWVRGNRQESNARTAARGRIGGCRKRATRSARGVERRTRSCSRPRRVCVGDRRPGRPGRTRETRRGVARADRAKRKRKHAGIAGRPTRAHHLELEPLRRRFRDVPELEERLQEILLFF